MHTKGMGRSRYSCIVYLLGFIVGLNAVSVFCVDVGARDVLDILQFINRSSIGYTEVKGTTSYTKAIYLEDPKRNLELPNSVVREALMLLRNYEEITFLATVKQETGDSGSIFSFSAGLHRFLELESSGRRDEIRLHYTHDQQTHVETFPYRIADNRWHQIALTFSGNHVTLYINCSKIYERVLLTLDKHYVAGKYLSLYIGQRNRQTAHFRGAIQELKLVTRPHGYLVQCPDQNTGCPTCAQFQALHSKMTEMYSLYQNLSIKLLLAEERLAGLEQCQCLKSCHQNGTERKEGELWKMDQCTVCTCLNGTIECRNIDCAPVDCPNPVHRNDECCPVCLTNCYYSGKYYNHGESLSPRVCVNCTCDNGMMLCETQDPETTCPKLDCDKSQIIRVHEQCCPICNGTDFCAKGHNCHPNATCVNLATRYACLCKSGFNGTGKHCEDKNECNQRGGKDGHHCQRDQKCVNTIGSYKCVCMTGHVYSDDDQSCSEINECEEGTHDCHEHAICNNTRGSYSCTCSPGFYGDGFMCKPSCDRECRNGGQCVGPNVCQCRHGFIGPSCEHDIDECALRIAECHEHSICINVPGWYRCDCLEGYHSNWPDNHYGEFCLDLNECVGEGEGHTCHPTTSCINTDGGYQCMCKNANQCEKKCLHLEVEHDDGSAWMSPLDKCLLCRCHEGITACHKKECNCSSEEVDFDCCPHCDSSSSCAHEESSLTFNNADRWEYQCQTCECLKGEIDCWPLVCPAKVCSQYIREPGDCCPRCADDVPCANLIQDTGGADLSEYTCNYKGETKRHGDKWELEADTCTECECKGGHICCAYGQACSSLDRISSGFSSHP